MLDERIPEIGELFDRQRKRCVCGLQGHTAIPERIEKFEYPEWGHHQRERGIHGQCLGIQRVQTGRGWSLELVEAG